MELKDMILSTLAELDDIQDKEKKEELKQEATPLIREEEVVEEEKIETVAELIDEVSSEEEFLAPYEDERHFCESMRERILVLFEGFQSPSNKSIEAKVDLTLNFLEYLLAVLDERLENLDKKS